MTKTQFAIYIILIGMLIFGVSSLVEAYKKVVRKNKSKVWENRIVGLILSIISIIGLQAIHVFKPCLGLIGAPLWADYIFYIGIFYYLQLQTDMKIIKGVSKSCVKILLSSYGLSKDQIEDILSQVKKCEK